MPLVGARCRGGWTEEEAVAVGRRAHAVKKGTQWRRKRLQRGVQSLGALAMVKGEVSGSVLMLEWGDMDAASMRCWCRCVCGKDVQERRQRRGGMPSLEQCSEGGGDVGELSC